MERVEGEKGRSKKKRGGKREKKGEKMKSEDIKVSEK